MEMYVEIKELDGVFRRLDNIDRGLNDLSPFLKEAGTVVVESTLKNIEDGGRPSKWASLSPTTVLLRSRRRKTGGAEIAAGAKPLRDFGTLMASIGNPAKEGIYKLEAGAITVGTALRYAAALHGGVESTGGYIPGKRVPARPFMVLHDRDAQNIYRLAVRFVDKVVRENQ